MLGDSQKFTSNFEKVNQLVYIKEGVERVSKGITVETFKKVVFALKEYIGSEPSIYLIKVHPMGVSKGWTCDIPVIEDEGVPEGEVRVYFG